MGISEMKDGLDWEELRLFLAVARGAGLSAAARRTGVSAPTLGRRMTALERRLRRKLFDRSRSGYALTEAGRDLYAQAQEMESVAVGIDRWLSGRARRVVRVSAGAWTSRFLARHFNRLWRPEDPMTIEFLTAAARLDIVRRQADIGIRNRAPEESRLSGRRTNEVSYAAYCSATVEIAKIRGSFIGVIGDGGITPSARWVAARHADDIVVRCSDPRTVVDLLLAGVGQAVLPCFVGDSVPGLKRVGGIMPELAEEQWLVLNEQERHQPAVRLVIDRIVALLQEHRALFRGDRPLE
jgi:DNA-binding transcriptional LysR family regulator